MSQYGDDGEEALRKAAPLGSGKGRVARFRILGEYDRQQHVGLRAPVATAATGTLLLGASLGPHLTLAGEGPRREHATARRAAQPALCQVGFDLGRLVLYD